MTITMTAAQQMPARRTGMTEAAAEFIRERDQMISREIDRICHDRAMTAMTGHGKQAEELAMTRVNPFQYHYEISRSAWVVTLDGHEIAAFMTQEEAAAYCAHENAEQKSQTIGGDQQ